MAPPYRVTATLEAEAVVARVKEVHGPLMLHRSGGCCDGSAPMCYPAGEFRIGSQDGLLGTVAADGNMWIDAAQFEYWRHTAIEIDVAPGRGAGFSLESSEGVRFHAKPDLDRQ